ncbi:MAG: TraR/DksA family transcriptional regulator [Patescibacteria group bacterium]|jgi:DnaK suppressor protein
MIDKKTLSQIEKELLVQKKKVLKELGNFTSKSGHDKDDHKTMFPEYGNKSDENAQEISEYSANIVTEKILEGTLRDIESALKRIKDGAYGICKYCKNEINPKRLIARPFASACVDCKKKLQSGS